MKNNKTHECPELDEWAKKLEMVDYRIVFENNEWRLLYANSLWAEHDLINCLHNIKKCPFCGDKL